MTALLGIFSIVPGWIWALITAGALATSCVQTTRVSMEKAAHATSRSAFDAERTKAAEAAQAQSEKYRTIEQELTNVKAKADSEAAALRLDLDRALGAGRVASDGLRNTVASAVTSTLAGCTASASAELREAAARTTGMLAQLYGELDRRAGIYAETADERGNAGAFCQSIHEAAVKATAQ